MISELLGAAQGVQALSTLLKAASSLSNYNEILLAVSEVNAKLMQAQVVGIDSLEKQRSQTDRIRELERVIQDFENWELRSRDYQLQAVGALKRDFAQIYRQSNHGSNPRHWACAKCFAERKLYILNQTHDECAYRCPNCNSSISPIISGGLLAPIESAYE